jgi:hypothetical protein
VRPPGGGEDTRVRDGVSCPFSRIGAAISKTGPVNAVPRPLKQVSIVGQVAVVTWASPHEDIQVVKALRGYARTRSQATGWFNPTRPRASPGTRIIME